MRRCGWSANDPIADIGKLLEHRRSSRQLCRMSDPIRFRVRPIYHRSDLLIEVMGDHRGEGFPDLAAILQDALVASKVPHPDNLDDPKIALMQDRYISFWTYAGGKYEIDDDIWGLFVSAKENNIAVIADVERALNATGRFAKEFVNFEQFR